MMIRPVLLMVLVGTLLILPINGFFKGAQGPPGLPGLPGSQGPVQCPLVRKSTFGYENIRKSKLAAIPKSEALINYFSSIPRQPLSADDITDKLKVGANLLHNYI
jgi:hypothetical protein